MHRETVNHATKQYPFLIEHLNVKYIPHFHVETEIVYVLDGTVTITIENNRFTLKKGEIGIILPEQIHNLDSQEYSRTFVMKLFPTTDIGHIQLQNCIITSDSAHYKPLTENIATIMRENENKEIGYEPAVNICAEKILLMIIRNMPHHRLENRVQSRLAGQNDFLIAVTAFLEQNYANDFTLDDAAQYMNYTKSYFCHRFKQITGVTFWKYYTIFRLEKSIQFMKRFPNQRFIEIAGEAGFKNIRSFNQAFKEYYRCTPREYMKRYDVTEQN